MKIFDKQKFGNELQRDFSQIARTCTIWTMGLGTLLLTIGLILFQNCAYKDLNYHGLEGVQSVIVVLVAFSAVELFIAIVCKKSNRLPTDLGVVLMFFLWICFLLTYAGSAMPDYLNIYYYREGTAILSAIFIIVPFAQFLSLFTIRCCLYPYRTKVLLIIVLLLFVTFFACIFAYVAIRISLADMERETLEEPIDENIIVSDGDDLVLEINGASYRFIKVDGGTFLMGTTSDDSFMDLKSSPQHEVTLSDYYIGETEVPQDVWLAVMEGKYYFRTQGDKQPVEYVKWEECNKFVEKLSKMSGRTIGLPTEAEWEYAARGGNKSQGYEYSGSNQLDDVAWYIGNLTHGSLGIQQVALKQPNELGIYDMSGNVSEFCQDKCAYKEGGYSSEAQTNPTGDADGTMVIVRGGSYATNANTQTVAKRKCVYIKQYQSHETGLRLVIRP